MKRHFLHDLFRNILMVVIVLLVTISAAGAATNRGLAVPNETLPAELKGVTVQDTYTGSGTNAVGEIQSVVGHVVVFREDKQYAYFAAPKDKLYERDVVYTLSASRCRFQMYSSDIATMAENTRIMIKTYINNRSTGVKSTSFAMKKGKAMFYALRLFMYKGSSMEVETPTAVTGVRGTKWGVEVVESKESASLPIIVADSSDLGAFRQLAQANTDSGYTIIHSFEGAVFVTSIATGISTTLQGGQSMNIGREGLGNTYPTPPEVSKQFQSDTLAQGGGGGTGTSTNTSAGTSTGSTGTNTGSAVSQPLPDTGSIIQDQNQQIQTHPVNKFGYYVGMLTDLSANAWKYTYISLAVQNLGSTNYQAHYPPATTTVSTYDSNTVKLVGLTFVAGEAASNLPLPVQWTEIGGNSYMAWGYWTQPVAIMVSGNPYSFNNKGYYVMGDVTSSMPTAISGTYSGIANGTVFSAVGGTDYSGTFSMNVAFAGGTGNVSAFNLSIGNPLTAGVSITGGAGSITGSGFTADTTTSGNVTINGATSSSGFIAAGSFYGPTGQMVGGVWQAQVPGYYANGNFYGSKP